ncbi:MAG: NADH-quinone oxidoreductase subunit L, partial [Rhodospirillaceae bacterium]
QNDIKRVIAYSTCSQLGYMFFAIGVSAYQAAIFHLMTHAFFKALLFLSAGSVIHAMSGEQDMRRMGGIAGRIKVTYAMMWVGSLALAGIPFFAGYYSKDIILEAAFGAPSVAGRLAFWMGIAAAFMTAFYSWRLLFMTFHGQPRADEKVMAHVHESPPAMLMPLLMLAAGALFSGWIGYESFVGEHREAFWGQAIAVQAAHDSIVAAHHVPMWVKLAPLIVGGGGIALAYLLYIRLPVLPGFLASVFNVLYKFLLNKWYFDELYDLLFVRPAFAIGRGLWKGGDGAVIDGIGPDGVAAASRDIARRLGRLQSGYIYHYAFAMIVGVAAFVTWFILFHLG